MSRSNKLLKLCALASSLLLAIGFVSFQAGAFDSRSESGSRATDLPEIKPVVDEENSKPAVTDHLMYSSKSAPVFVPADEEAALADDELPNDPSTEPVAFDQTIMSGSKVLLPTKPPIILKELVQSEDYGVQSNSKSDEFDDGDQ
jgi:hypothetical protein